MCQLLIIHIFPPRIPQSAIYFKNSLINGHGDIIYLVDSTNDTPDTTDFDKGPISQFLERLLVCERVNVLGQAAAQPDLYAAYASYISRLKPAPKYLIVEINMRSFSKSWDAEKTYQFEEQKLYYRVFANTLLMPFWPFFSNTGFLQPESLPENKFTIIPFFNRMQQFGFLKDEEKNTYKNNKVSLKKSIELHYLYTLTANHRKVQSLLEIADLFKDKKTKVIFYFTPINYEPKVTFIGKSFIPGVKKNIDLIKALLKKKAIILDVSLSLPHKAFTTKEGLFTEEGLYINEHLKEEGRHFVAGELAKIIKNTR